MADQGNKFPGGLVALSEEDLSKAEAIAAKVAEALQSFAQPNGDMDKATFGSMLIGLSGVTAWLIESGFASPELRIHALNLFTKSVVEKLGIEFTVESNEVKL